MARLLVPGYELQSMFYVCTRRLALPDCIGKLAATELLPLTVLHCDSSPHQHPDWRP